jgi:hypothetical protein
MQMLAIFEPEQQQCIIKRAAKVAVSDYLHHTAQHIAPGIRHVMSLKQPLVPQLHALALPQHPCRADFIQDIAHLMTVFAELLDCHTVGLRIEVLQKAMCPQFHVDHTGIRLLCTYLGPGTEWLEEAFADRSYLNHIVLLKGSQWQGNHTGGAIHRSPAVPDGQLRVVLALDAMSD